jgi:hypothetical protein
MQELPPEADFGAHGKGRKLCSVHTFQGTRPVFSDTLAHNLHIGRVPPDAYRWFTLSRREQQ